MLAAISGQSGAGMVYDTFTEAPHMTEAEALALLPSGTSIHAASIHGWCAVHLNITLEDAKGFACFCGPLFVFGFRNGPVVFIRRSNLARLCELWEIWA